MKKSTLTILLIALLASFGTSAQGRIVTIASPKLTVYLPPKPAKDGKTIIACPGGGYSHLAIHHEGHDWAPFFNNQGIAYAVLEYQMPEGNRQKLLNEVESAFKILKDSAAVWHINPENIGIMGSSAGGHLASTVATHPTEIMSPAFQLLFYPVISLDPAITHAGTRHGFLGDNPAPGTEEQFSSDKAVSTSTPRALMLLSADDKTVVPQNSINYFTALRAAGVPASMHIWPEGGHGWGNRDSFRYHTQVLDEITAWLASF